MGVRAHVERVDVVSTLLGADPASCEGALMAWLRIDDTVPEHRKMLAAGPAACWLWVCGIAYCQRQLTDGFIPELALSMIGVTGAARAKKLAEVLVEAGLFEAVDGGYRVHDYHDHNASKDEALARKEAISLKRSAAGKRGAVGRWQNGKSIATGDSKPIAPSHPNTKNPPTPPSVEGGRITRAERHRAEELRRRAFGCTHDPRCATYEACIVTIVLGLREQAASA